MDRRVEASHRGQSSYRGRGWRGRGRGGGRPSPSPPSSTASPAALNPTPTPAVPVDDAAPIMGTCPDMCPARERAQRERLRDLAVLERVGGDPTRTSPSLAVKKMEDQQRNHTFRERRKCVIVGGGKSVESFSVAVEQPSRTISSTNVLPSDIRPLPVLQETMDYLLHLLDSSEHPFETIHDFIFDRTRSIRQDLSMQNIVNDQAVQIYEDVVTFHIRSHQRLSTSCQVSDASSLCYLNMEQLTKCLLSLYDMYHVLHKRDSHSKKEAEYYSFYVLLHLGCKIHKMIDSLSLWYGQLASPVRRSKEMIFARTLLRCYRLGNFKRFFCMVAAEATDRQLRLVEPFLNEVRARALMYFNHSGYKLQHHPLEHVSGILMIEESELESLCGICGLEISKSEGMKAFVPKQTSFTLPTFMPQSNGIYISREVER